MKLDKGKEFAARDRISFAGLSRGGKRREQWTQESEQRGFERGNKDP